MENLKNLYLQHIQLKNYSEFTIRQNEQYLRIFLQFLRSQGITDIKQVKSETLEAYKKHLFLYQRKNGKTLSGSTINGRLIQVKIFFQFLCQKGSVFSNPAENLEMPRQTRPLPRGIMTVKEITRILKQPDLKKLLGYRDRTILEMLYATGIRAGELTRLKIADVDFKKKLLRITKGKGGKDRFVPLNTPTCRFLKRYLSKFRIELAQCPRPCGHNWRERAKTGEGVLFLTSYGGALTCCWLATMLKKYIKQAGITKEVAPCHSFRHSVATHLLEDGMDIRYVQAFLGHENIQTTQVYTHVEKEKLREMLEKYHPLAHKETKKGIDRFPACQSSLAE